MPTVGRYLGKAALKCKKVVDLFVRSFHVQQPIANLNDEIATENLLENLTNFIRTLKTFSFSNSPQDFVLCSVVSIVVY